MKLVSQVILGLIKLKRGITTLIVSKNKILHRPAFKVPSMCSVRVVVTVIYRHLLLNYRK